MTAQKGEAEKWRQITVLVRDDILVQADAAGLDIGETCNRALAAATGISYGKKKPAKTAPAAPVIIAQNGKPAAVAAEPAQVPPPALPEEIHPVINADDPRSATTVRQVPKAAARKAPAALPGRVTPPEKPAHAPPAPAAPSVPEKEPVNTPATGRKKAPKGPVIRQFVADAISRDGSEDCHVPKDVLYEAFARWCREHRVQKIPDRRAVTIALKNQLAIPEKVVDGEPSWAGIRLR